jgi:predicted Zn-dependent protease
MDQAIEPAAGSPAPPPAKTRQQDAKAASPRTRAGQTELEKKRSDATRRVRGKTFEQRDNVWYDTAYTGQPTTNVRRATNRYRALDKDLRAITDSIPGTVVVLWKQTAYRISP